MPVKLLFLLLSLLCSSLVMASEDLTFNNGQNILQPITRLDVLLEFQSGVTSVEGDCTVLTLRGNKVIDLPDGWQMSFRGDVPYSWYTCPRSRVAFGCTPDAHFADVLVQALLITPPWRNWTYGTGLRIVFPTDGGNTEIGDAKYELHPSVAVAYDLSEWSEGANCGIFLRQGWSVGGYPSAARISQTYIEPFFNVNLPSKWFISVSPEIIYNWVSAAWFVPFDLMVGKMITPNIVASIEYENAIVKDYHKFSQQVELRLGYFF